MQQAWWAGSGRAAGLVGGWCSRPCRGLEQLARWLGWVGGWGLWHGEGPLGGWLAGGWVGWASEGAGGLIWARW